MKNFFVLIFFLNFGLTINGQDSIFKKNHEIIEAKVLEVNEKNIRYKLFREPEGPFFILSVTQIHKIQLAGGTIIEFKEKKKSKDEELELTFKDSLLFMKQKAAMIDFFSPMFGHIGGGYQWLLNPKMIGQVKVGMIGLYTNKDSLIQDFATNYGLYVSPSVKFKTESNFIKYAMIVINPIIGVTSLLLDKNQKKALHPLHTSYLKPQLSLAYKRTTETVFITNLPGGSTHQVSSKADFNNYSIAINLCFGQQVLVTDFLLLDYFFGMGYGFYTKRIVSGLGTLREDYFEYFHSHMIIRTNTIPITFTAGISFGILMK